MNDQLSKLLEKAIEVAEKTGDFAIEQAPLLLQEFYSWRIASNIFGIVLALLMCYIPYILRLCISKKEEEGFFDEKILGRWFETDEIPFILWCVLGVVSSLIGVIVFLCSVYELIFILVAPKLYLIEYFIK